ncbi:MAG: topoisomerase protein [Candidatus Moranbacteria bacterium GW2011_GWE1_49_15]|nr:MAG: topoisomerase protein [Candidatus Moranbacteria bacterium GW2011_GWE2_47_10]KKW06476.1 MAG: topoisomerase protein [Candidatus Moranbacteria bacterium GW2011_GWE1_49_15]HBP01194.1 type I DNA topoisomerase [Candidatus Moranbacteria bacterium]
MKLVIVESPTKAKTISKFLGKGFTVKSSFGHVRDLPKSEMGIDIEKNFEPRYVVPTKAREKISSLKESLKKADEVILASDEDREGEAISWHLIKALDLEKKNKKPYSRIVFHEITKSAIQKALEHPRELDLNLVDAQQARRVLDRLVGYELSPFLWKKIRRGLSAGRVQSVALRLIVEREREIEKFQSEQYWTIGAELAKKGDAQIFPANLIEKDGEKIEKTQIMELFSGKYTSKKTTIENQKSADEIVADLKTASYQVSDLTKKEAFRNPPAPFTTSTLQQASISNLGWSAKQTMMVAQKLYELGHITYMRTDSVNLSLESLLSAQKSIEANFGKQYALESPRYFKTKSKSAQEAHEAIRPTNLEATPEDLEGSLDSAQLRLYKLIWNRTIACQMQSAKLSQVKVDISAKGKSGEYLLRANGSTVIFDGFLKVYGEGASKETFLPEMENGEELEAKDVTSTEKATTPPPRYNEASLVKVMEEHGIGRPSTYAPTISTIFERKYIDKNEDKKLIPLEIGMVVNDTLVEHFPQIVDIDFTANMEEDLDGVAEGKKDWVPLIRDFYEPFHQNLEKKTETVKKEDFVEKLDRKCPDCGSDLIVKFGRFGKFIACSKYPECKFTEKTAEEKKVDDEFSGETCEKCGKPMVVKRGRFGPFLGCSGYPECKNIKGIEKKTGVKCPKCKDGEIVEKKSKRGRIFYGCNKYPACDFAMWNKPTGEMCPRCGQPLAFAAKGMVKCSSKECGFEQ